MSAKPSTSYAFLHFPKYDNTLFSHALFSCRRYCVIFAKYSSTLFFHRRRIDSFYQTWTCYPAHKHWCGISGNNEWRNWYKNDLVDPFLHSRDKKSWWFKVSWSSDAYIHQKTGQSLIQILACIWVTPCHYLDQWWHFVSWVPWIIDNDKRWWIWKFDLIVFVVTMAVFYVDYTVLTSTSCCSAVLGM